MKLSNSKEVLRLMAAGWELLGHRAGRFGMSVKLCLGDEEIQVHRSTLEAMERRKEIRRAEWRKDDPPWLRRYERGGEE